MTRNNRYPAQGALLLAALIVVGIAVFLTACVTPPGPFDMTRVNPCEHEDGPARGTLGPCVWDSERVGVHPGGSPVRWILYTTTCPVATVQDSTQVTCVPMDRWGE
jgi:hypothetical protein